MADLATSLARLDPADAWLPWTPDAQQPWNLKWAEHLYRRAAFGATWNELQRAISQGPEKTLDRLLTGGDGREDFDQLMDAFAPEAPFYQPFEDNSSLQGWWLYRMIHTPHPFQERMTLFWHNHFATSIVKVRQPALMKQQNFLLRKHALGKLRPLVLDISRDPAMLIWLDSNSNVKGKPNENYARELLELFTLGVGNYTESDIREAARAFTGWHTSGDDNLSNVNVARTFAFRKFLHDDGPKTVLGQTGAWNGDDVVRVVLEQPAAARFLVRKLYRHFIGESVVPPDRLIEPLAEQFRKSEYDVAALMRTLLRSRHFFSEFAYRQRIKSPVEFLVGLLRTLEGKNQGEGATLPLPVSMNSLGQTLFAPPSVKGWDGGKAWLNSATLLARHNLAWRFLLGVRGPLAIKVNPLALIQKHVKDKDFGQQVDFLLDLLLSPERRPGDDHARAALVAFLAKNNPRGEALDRRLRETAHAVVLMPKYQLT
jgi:uncharacterized protein (DUF1800 family)